MKHQHFLDRRYNEFVVRLHPQCFLKGHHDAGKRQLQHLNIIFPQSVN